MISSSISGVDSLGRRGTDVSGDPEKWNPFSSADPAVGPGEAPYGKKIRTRVIPCKINGLNGKNGGFFTCRPKSL